MLVLLFMLVFGLVLGALISNATANLRNTTVVRNQESKVYAADAGIDWGLQTVRNTNTACPSPGAPVALGNPSFNGQTTAVTCAVTAGTTTGALGYALITDSLATVGGAAATINGPVLAASIEADAHLSVANGDVESCSAQPPAVTIAPQPPYSYRSCAQPSTGGKAAAVPHALPSAPPAPQGVNGVMDGVCTVFSPGTYTNIALGRFNYFEPGVYYFENVRLDLTVKSAVGGARSASEQSAIGLPCDTHVSGGSSGVKWILGGSSSINVGKAGQLELFAPSNLPDEGTPGISIQTVQAPDPDGWTPSTLGAGDSVIHEDSGATPAIAIHGMVYTPNAAIDLPATGGAVAWLLGAVVSGRIRLGQQGPLDGVRLEAGTNGAKRVITLTSTVAPGNESQAVATAVVEVTNDGARSSVLQSWRTSCRLSDASACPGT